jgi:O-antigen/teichoic acid export membrane protein
MLSIALLPLATRVLQASDYGTYALLMSIVTLVSMAMDGGASLLLPANYGPASTLERGKIFVSVALVAGLGASTVALLIAGLWIWLHRANPNQVIPIVTIALTAIIIPMRAVTSISITMFSVTGRSLAIAAQMAGQAVLVFVGTLVALYGFSMEGVSLFIGAACGQFAALCICLLALLYHSELSSPSRRWFQGAMTSAPATAISGFADGGRVFGENAMLAGAGGVHAIGILSHARLYYNLLMALGTAVAHNVKVRSLNDARDPLSSFDSTQRAWVPVQIAFSCAGIIFVFLGNEIVEIISNGKLTEAASYIPALIIIALIQITEQPATAIVYASGRAADATWFRTITVLCSLVVLYPLIIIFGIVGIIAVGIVEAALYRRYIHILAGRERDVPFQDGVTYFGCLVIIAAMVYKHFEMPPLSTGLLAMAGGIAIIFIIGHRSIGEMIAAVRHLIVPKRIS